MAKQLPEDAEGNEVRRGVEQGEQIGQPMKATNERTERRMEEDLDRRFERPENPEDDRRTATEKQRQDHGDDQNGHGVLRVPRSGPVAETSAALQMLSPGLQSVQGANQLNVQRDDRRTRKEIDKEQIEGQVTPTKPSTLAQITVAFGDQQSVRLQVLVGRRDQMNHLVDAGNANDFVLEDQRNGVEQREKKQHSTETLGVLRTTEAFAVDRITNQDPPIDRHGQGDPQRENTTTRCQRTEENLQTTKENHRFHTSTRLERQVQPFKAQDRQTGEQIRER